MTKPSVAERIRRFNQGREHERLALKYRAMRSGVFPFLRGTCHLFYEDWPHDKQLDAAPLTWICGDLHLENFGSFKGDNRLTYFDLNDFDEAVLAPCTWEISRFLVSVLVAAETLGVNHAQANKLCQQFLDAYITALADGKARWIERSTSDGMIRSLLQSLKQRSRAELLASRTRVSGGKRMLRIDGKKTLKATDEDYAKVTHFMAEFASTQADPAFFKVRDVARRIAGTGSLGVERYVILIRGLGDVDGNQLLDLKRALPSALAPYLGPIKQPEWKTEAERVVAIQHRIQAISPAFLSAVSIGQNPYVMRELLPNQDRLRLELWNGKIKRLERVMVDMGRLVAWGHLRSCGRQGSAVMDALIEFAGESSAWQKSVLDYAADYGDQVTLGWQEFSEAYDDGYFATQVSAAVLK